MAPNPEPFRLTREFDEQFVKRSEFAILQKWWAGGSARPLAVVGPPAIGKSWLVQALAREVARSFGDPQIAQKVWMPEVGGMLDEATIRSALPPSGRSLLAFEEVDDEAALHRVVDVAEVLHRREPRIGVLAVSRMTGWPQSWGVLHVGALARVEQLELVQRLIPTLSPDEQALLGNASEGSPLAAKLLAGMVRNESLPSVLARLGAQQFQTLFPSDQLFPSSELLPGASAPSQQEFDVRVAAVNDELIRRLSVNPDLLYDLHPRKFEELIAELYERQGFDVELTKQTRDGGVDLYIVSSGALGTFTTLVDAKRNRRDRPVGVGVVRQLYGVVEAKKATAGIIATTSFFTPDAQRFQKDVEGRMTLRDYFDLQTMLRNAAKE